MEANGEALVKGTGVLSAVRWLRDVHGETVYGKIFDKVSAETRAAMKTPMATEWYPARVIDEIWQTQNETTHPNDPAGFEQEMISQGQFIAEDNLSSVMKVMLIFVSSPEHLFGRLEKFWDAYFSGIGIELDGSQLDHHRGVCEITNLGTVHHIAPIACGWLSYGFRKVGAKDVDVLEQGYRAGRTAADPLRFQISWS